MDAREARAAASHTACPAFRRCLQLQLCGALASRAVEGVCAAGRCHRAGAAGLQLAGRRLGLSVLTRDAERDRRLRRQVESRPGPGPVGTAAPEGRNRRVCRAARTASCPRRSAHHYRCAISVHGRATLLPQVSPSHERPDPAAPDLTQLLCHVHGGEAAPAAAPALSGDGTVECFTAVLAGISQEKPAAPDQGCTARRPGDGAGGERSALRQLAGPEKR